MTDALSSIDSDAYSVLAYGRMIADRVRTKAYVEALRRTIRPGSFVVELGTGPGIFALVACRLGARKVVAIESDSSIDLARELAEANNCADKIEFIQALSLDVELPERADVIVSDLRGALPLHELHIPSLIDARKRFLAPDGWLIPWKDTLWGALVREEQSYRKHVDAWREAVPQVEAESARTLVTNTWWNERFSPSQLLTAPQSWARIDYHTIEEANFEGRMEWMITESSSAHGLGAWFGTDLAEGVSFSGAPGKARLIYGHAFFPFSEPLELSAGDRVVVSIQASLVGDDYQWRWKTDHWAAGKSDRASASFDQCTIYGTLLTPARLRRTTAAHEPRLTDDGKVAYFTLGQMAEGVVLGKVADALVAEFPERFASWDDAFRYVARLSNSYST